MSSNLIPAMTGTRALGNPTSVSWLTSEPVAAVSYEGARTFSSHVQLAAAVPAGGFVAGADAARKRGRPPRGEPR